jgi:hypothetical protein
MLLKDRLPSLQENGWGIKLPTHVHLAMKSRMVELYFHSPISFMA